MKIAVRMLVSCLLFGLAVLVGPSMPALGDAPSSGSGLGSSSPLGKGLVVPGSPVEGEQLNAEAKAKLSSPEAKAEREASRTEFEKLDSEQAGNEDKAAFPSMISDQAGGPPPLPAGQRITGYASANAAQVDLGNGDSGIVESTTPIALETSEDIWAPVNLGLNASGNAFVPKSPLTDVRIPKQLAEGISAPASSVSMTPVNEQGAPLGGSSGVMDGATIFYGNTETDTDMVAKPSTFGFEISTLLRSIESPQQLFFRVSLPEGARLEQAKNGVENALIVKEGAVIGVISAPTAQDAAGTAVPLHTSVSGAVLTVSVDHRSASYEYPISVDPEFVGITEDTFANWHYAESPGGGYSHYKEYEGLSIQHPYTSFPNDDYAAWAMQTNGYTKIYMVSTETTETGSTISYGESGEENQDIRSWIQIEGPGGLENETTISGLHHSGEIHYVFNWCVHGPEPCTGEHVGGHNAVAVGVTTTTAGTNFFGLILHSSTIYLDQEKGLHTTVNYASTPEVDGTTNVLYAGGDWIGPHSGAFEFTASDLGLGVLYSGISAYNGGEKEWEPYGGHSWDKEPFCKEIQCSANESEAYTYNSLIGTGLGLLGKKGNKGQHLPDGEDTIRVSGSSAMNESSSTEYGEGVTTLKVDSKSPYGITLTGLPGKEEELELGEVESHVKAEASDGEGVASSGIKAIELYVDGKETGKPAGYCSPGPCTATGEWSLNGAELGVGEHTLTVKATDNADNVATRTYGLTVYAASPVAMGPGSVNPESGDFALEASDVDLSGGMGSLSVTRHYDSRNTKEGKEGPLGPQWTIGLGSLAQLEVLPDSSVLVIGPAGLTHFSVKEGGGFEAPAGDASLTLEYEPKTPAYLLKDQTQGTTTEFTLPEGAELWEATVSKGPVATDTMTDEYKTVEVSEGKKIVEPTLELAPHPTASCAHKELEELASTAKGCRALEFKYYKETTAHGEAKSEWGGYKNRLQEVVAVAYNPSAGKMAKTHVAEYEYDGQGRLRAEWNPEISPALKTVYGYDAEGHVTALTPPGHEPWIFTYGTSAGDVNAGRLLSTTRPSSSTKPGDTSAPVDTGKPALSSSEPEVGTTLSTSNGTWSNSPLSYGYQWEDCSGSGTECSPIAGATNKTYMPLASDEEHTLVVKVSAANMDGSTTALSSSSNLVQVRNVSWFGSKGTGNGQLTNPDGAAVDSKGDIWVVDSGNDRVEEFSSAGTYIKAVGSAGSGNGQLTSPSDVAIDSAGDLYVTDTGNNRVEKFNEKGEYLSQFSTYHLIFHLKSPIGIAINSEGNLWVVNSGAGTVMLFSPGGEYIFEFGGPGFPPLGAGFFQNAQGLAIGSGGALWIADSGNSRVQECTPHTEFGLKTVGCRIAASAGSGNGQFSTPIGVTLDSSGDIWVADYGNDRIEELSPSGTYLHQIGTKGSGHEQMNGPIGMAADSAGDVYVVDRENDRVGKWTVPAPKVKPPAPPNPGTSSVTTIEYRVPLSIPGSQSMTGIEVAKWGEKDDPVEAAAAAIFPPDEPQGWPASSYKRATIYYLDSEGRRVNVASPSGGISTTEYNENNDAVRSLTADNRVAALAEGSKSAEVAELLSTESKYNGETKEEREEEEKEPGGSAPGTQLLETLGPEHKVKLSGGTEVSARSRAQYSYDEDAPKGETYDLVTKTTGGALLSGGEERDIRTTKTSYGGQGVLGWKLRQPTSVTTDPSGLDLTHATLYDENTGNVVETKSPAGSQTSPAYSSQFGSAGSGSGQLGSPKGIALDGKGDVVVADEENARVDVFRENGEFLKSFGSRGTGAGEFLEVRGVAVDSKGDIWTEDQGNDRVQEFNEKGEYLRKVGSYGTGAGQFNEPKGIAIDIHNNVWVTDTGNDRVEKFNEKGEFLAAVGFGVSDGKEEFEICTSSCRAGNPGSGDGQLESPRELAVDSSGDVWVTDTGNNRVEEFKENGDFVKAFGSYGTGDGQFREPKGITVDAHNNVWVTDAENNRVEEFNEAGEYETQFGSDGTGHGQFNEPWGVQVDAHGEIFVSDVNNNRIEKFSPVGAEVPLAPAYSSEFGSYGSGSGQFEGPKGIVLDGKGHVLVADEENHRVDVFMENGEFVKSFGSYGTGSGQFLEGKGVAVDSKADIWVVDQGNNRVEEFNEKGEYKKSFGSSGTSALHFKEPKGIAINSHNDVLVADTANNRVEELNEKGEFLRTFGFGVSNGKEEFEVCTSSCRAGKPGSGKGQLEGPRELAIDASDNVWVTDTGNNRVEEFNEKGEYLKTFGSYGTGNGQFREPKGITVDANDNVWVTDAENNRIEEFNKEGEYETQLGSEGTENGQFNEPWGIQVNTHGEVFVSDANNNRIEKFAVVNSSGNPEAHDIKTIYYTAGTEAAVTACQDHPEWVNLPCQTAPAAQPTDGIDLPVTTITYNMWDQAETITEVFGSTTRTKKTTFDGAGRPLTTEETSSNDTTLPKVTDKYDESTGALETESTTVGGTTRTITSARNTLDQLTSYTDADGNTTTYEYEPEGDDRLKGINDGKGTQTYSYDTTTGFLTRLVDSAAGTFTASYDVEGNMTSETYPNGMTETNTFNPLGQATGLEYVKTTHCSSGCTWFSDNVTPSIYGESLSQTSTLAKEDYAYDSIGRLTEAQETPAGKGCTTRLYAYDEESNRTSLITREPGGEGKCATEGGSTERHIYDEANRLIDEGVAYEVFGNTTTLPAADAGGHEITTSYYVDNQVATQTQNEKTLSYQYDPAGRTIETLSEEGKTLSEKEKSRSVAISNYSGPGEALSWTSEGPEKWTRNIPGIDGALDAIQSNSGTVVLQLHDLQGNIVGTVGLGETETKLLETYNSTEFGVPTTSKPPKYSWLGADGVSSELSSGAVTQDGATYVPQTGLALQTESPTPPVPVNAGTPFVSSLESWVIEGIAKGAARQVAAAEAAREALGGDCDEEIEGCGPDPEHGDNSAFCSVWVSWDHYFNNRLGVTGHSFCVRPEIFEMEIALLEELPGGKFRQYEESYKAVFHNAEEDSHDTLSHTWVCVEPKKYQAWVWGRFWYGNGKTQWYASAEDGHTETCSGLAPNGDPTSGSDSGSYDN